MAPAHPSPPPRAVLQTWPSLSRFTALVLVAAGAAGAAGACSLASGAPPRPRSLPPQRPAGQPREVARQGSLEQLELRERRHAAAARGGPGAGSRRRALLPLVGAGLLGCLCAGCAAARRAEAMATLTAPPADQLERFDRPRDKTMDAAFAQGMAYGMVDYERAVSKRKRRLFERLLSELPKQDAVLVEIGMGSFPNALYVGSKSAPTRMDIVGVDPNDSMEAYAREKAERARLLDPEKGNSLRIVHGVAEALPLATGSADAVVCTLTLCSVLDPPQAVAEIRRVLKPRGRFLFHEHVLSETNPVFAAMQRQATPAQVERADGCHLDRRTMEIIRGGGFRAVDGEYFELEGFNYLNPTVAGIATA